MFTGIVQTTARVSSAAPAGRNGCVRITFELKKTIGELRRGDSISVDGTCLTITSRRARSIQCDIIPESLRKTIAKTYRERDVVNIEPPARWGSPISGHWVSGHVDTTATIHSVTDNPRSGRRIEIAIPKTIKKYCVDRGSITINGVSLTIASLTARGIVVAITPTTLDITTIGIWKRGQNVNIEIDQLVKTVYHFLHYEN